MKFKILIMSMLFLATININAQDFSKIKIDPIKEKQFLPYVAIRHDGPQSLEIWKADHKYDYIKQMWYFSESFYIKRNHLSTGVTLDESIIDIARFENERKADVESIVALPGFKDVIVLLPKKDCFYIHSN